MKRFAELFRRLDQTTSTNRKVEALAEYFLSAEPRDAAWAVYFLSGQRLKRLVNSRLLREWVAEETGYPLWLVEDCYASVGDLAETIALLLDDPGDAGPTLSLADWAEQRIAALADMDDAQRREAVTRWWAEIDADQRFLLNKLITGAFRVGVSRRLVTRALAAAAGIDPAVVAHRLMGEWRPSAENFRALISTEATERAPSTPYPFFLASPLEDEPANLGDPALWLAEWKWDGIRAQAIRRSGEHFVWSRGEDLLNGRFPEIEAALTALPDGTVLDGEVLAWRDEAPLPFSVLQTRIGRKKPGKKSLDKAPLAFLAYDLLEHGGEDLRACALEERRQALSDLVDQLAHDRLRLSTAQPFSDWAQLAELREQSRDRGVEGFILKRLGSPYRVGRTRGDWWKWKIDPHTVDAVMIYAQPGSGRRSNLLTDYTFGVWDGDTLVPFAKAYSGLTQKEIEELDRWIRRNTVERFGPVRSVRGEQVFELAFEGINPSTRHKSGVAVRFPRIARWRRDLGPRDADTLEQVRALIA